MKLSLNNLSFLARAGSQAHGTSTENSDVDVKGFVMPPADVRNNIFQKFTQVSDHPMISEKWNHLRNPKNPKMESTLYSLERFLYLAETVNPSMLEIIWVDDADVLFSNKIGDLIRANRHLFLSSRAKYTYSGYALAQFEKINRHRRWLLNPPAKQPSRKEFGLLDEPHPEYAQVDAYIRRQIETWNISKFEGLSEMERFEIKEHCWDLVCSLDASNKINWDNWPEAYYKAALLNLQNEIRMPRSTLDLLACEKKYQNALKEWQGYQHWQKERNPERKVLEAKFQMDTKHAAHLVRLLNTGLEVLETSQVKVRRPDAQLYLDIRHGAWSYEQLTEFFYATQPKLDAAYLTTKLPKKVDTIKINDLYLQALEMEHTL